MCKKLTTTEYIERATKVYSGKYKYDKTVYDGINSYVCVTCQQHGDFTQRADKHLAGMEGCSECHKASYADEGKWSNENILKEIKLLAAEHGYAQAKDSDTSLGAMARRRFGSWEEACRVAGVISHKEFVPYYTTCTIAGCTRPTRSGTCPWCETHYYRNRRNGDPEKLQLCQYSVDSSVFDTWNDSNAWLLGLLWTDGWMGRGNSIGIKLKDIQLLEEAKSVFNTDVEIKTAYTKGKEYKYFSIASKPLADRLREIGMYPAKTLTIQYPQELPPELFGSFMRGVIDGDGTVWLKCRKRARTQIKDCNVSFVSGSPAFAKQMQTQLKQRGIKCVMSVRRKYLKSGKLNKHWGKHDVYKIQVGSQASLRKLYEMMYPGCDVPCLHRKRDKFTEYYVTPRPKAGNPNHKIGFWTQDKLDILKPMYLDPNCLIEKIVDTFGCSWNHIQWAAQRKLGIKRPCYWTEQDDAVLRENYAIASWEQLQELFPARTKIALSQRASVLDLSRPRTNRPSHDGLIELYEDQQLHPSEIAVMFDVGTDTVRQWLADYGIKRRRPTFRKMEFDAARAMVRAAKLSSIAEYKTWRKQYPTIPVKPQHYDQWQGWSDWLGTHLESSTEKWLRIAEAYVKEHGKLPMVSVLHNTGYSGLSKALSKQPEIFVHLPQDSSDKKDIRFWVKLAESMASENSGVLQNVGWLQKNGYKALDAAMRRQPEQFIHIQQHRKTKPMTLEVRAKVSAIRKGRPWSESRRAAQTK